MNLPSYAFTIFALALLVHGLGHSMGIIQSWGVAKMVPGSTTGGFLTHLGAGDTEIKTVGLLFGVVLVGFLAALFGFWQGLQWWRPLTMAMSATSIGLFAIWWGTLPTSSQIGAISFDVAAILAAYFWP